MGVVGIGVVKAYSRFPGPTALSDNQSLGDEEFTAHFTWPSNPDQRYTSLELANQGDNDRWSCTLPEFSYKKVWCAQRSFRTGVYGFPSTTYFYELLRRLYYERISFDRLFAPVWFVESVGEMICRREGCPDQWDWATRRQGSDRVTFRDCIHAWLRCTDPHVQAQAFWILMGKGYRIAKWAWPRDARTGRMDWGGDGTQYNHGGTPRTNATGGMASEFDRRIKMILDQENSNS